MFDTGIILFQHTIDSVVEYLEHTIYCCFCGVWNDMRPVPKYRNKAVYMAGRI